MQILHLNIQTSEIISKFLCHSLGKSCNKNLMPLRSLLLNLTEKIFYLAGYRTYIYLRIQQSGRSYNLFCTNLFMFLFVICRSCRYIKYLIHSLLKFLEVQRSVVHSRWKSETEVYQSLLTGLVASKHTSYLRQCNMGLINYYQVIIAEEIYQCIRWISRFSACKDSCIVFDTGTEARLAQHFNIILCTFTDTLCFEQLIVGLEPFYPLFLLFIYLLKSRLQLMRRNNVVGCRENA